MTDNASSEPGPFPAPPVGPSPRPRSRVRVVVVGIVGLALVAGLVVGGLALALYALNPVGDEWICSAGEAPAGNACYPEGATLPPGVTWDPLGNRPMSYNCDKDGWVEIVRDDEAVHDCIREGTALPRGYHVVPD